MKCDDLLAILNEYVDGEIDPGICSHLEKHLADCNPCRVVVDTIRKTIALFKDDEPYALPEPFEQRLHAALRAQWAKTHR